MKTKGNVERDLGSVSSRETAVASMDIISSIQDKHKGVQAASITCAFLMLMRKLNIRPNNALTYADNMMRKTAETNPEFRALQMYMENEI